MTAEVVPEESDGPPRAKWRWRGSVRQFAFALLTVAVALIFVVGAIGAVALSVSTRAVDQLSDQLGPAGSSSASVYEDLLRARSALRAYEFSGDPGQLRTARTMLARVDDDARSLADFARTDPSIAADLAALEQPIAHWRRTFAAPLLRAPGRMSFNSVRYQRERQAFARIDAASDTLDSHLATHYAQVQDTARSRLHATIALIVITALAGGLALLLLGRVVINHFRRPLGDIEGTIVRLADGNHSARAEVGGPPDVERVALALNRLADENERGHLLESEIHRQLREADRAKTDFVSNVSHELRTPLTSIAGYLELIEENVGEELEPPVAAMFETTERNVARLRALIENLLTLAQAEQSERLMSTADVGGLVRDAVADLRLSATNRRVVFDLADVDEGVRVRGDADQLRRALQNLLSNAVKFSPEGGSVELVLGSTDREAQLLVRDHGMGIPDDELGRLGTRFFRASNAVAGEIAGTGLGFRIAQAILSNHDGSVTVRSKIGSGTDVLVRLPLAQRP